MPPQPRNTALFDRVADHISEHPDRYDQMVYCDWPDIRRYYEEHDYNPPTPPTLTSTQYDCDSVMCIAGWTAWLNDWRPRGDPTGGYLLDTEWGHHVGQRVESVVAVAAEALHITINEATTLFSPLWRPGRKCTEPQGSEDLTERVALALKCIGRGMAVYLPERMTKAELQHWLAEYQTDNQTESEPHHES